MTPPRPGSAIDRGVRIAPPQCASSVRCPTLQQALEDYRERVLCAIYESRVTAAGTAEQHHNAGVDRAWSAAAAVMMVAAGSKASLAT